MEKGCVMINCRECRTTSFVTPHAQKIRCRRCERVIWVKNQEPYSSSYPNSAAEPGKIVTNGKGFLSFPVRTLGTEKRNSTQKNNYTVGSRSFESCPSVIVPSPSHRKRAVLCGVTYSKQKIKLQGTKYDVQIMRSLLIERFDFLVENMRILTEEEGSIEPTRKNIFDALNWLVKDNESGDSLVFFFSGHGLQQLDVNNEELDGFDETLCPVDFKTEGMIIDNDINETIVKPLKKGVKLHAIIDTCHSGTVLDLPYVYRTQEKKWNAGHLPTAKPKGTKGGRAICLSACEDDQQAADTNAFSTKTMSGAMTYNFVRVVKEKKSTSYGQILDSMHAAIKWANEKRGFRGRFFRACMRRRGIPQDPLLSSSEIFDINDEFIL